MIAEGLYQGVQKGLTATRDGNLVVTPALGGYEAAVGGRLFGVSMQAGATTQAGYSATTVFALANPPGSDVNLVIHWAGYATLVAWAAAAIVGLGLSTNVVAAAVSGTDAVVRALGLGISVAARGRAYTAATLPATPVVGPLLGVGLTGAITTVPNTPIYGRYFRPGELVLLPGTAVSIQTSTASGSSGLIAEIIWEEVTR